MRIGISRLPSKIISLLESVSLSNFKNQAVCSSSCLCSLNFKLYYSLKGHPQLLRQKNKCNLSPKNCFHVSVPNQTELNESVADQGNAEEDNESPPKKRKKKRTSKYDVALPHEHILAELRNCSSFEHQVEKFCELVKIPEEEVTERLQICEHLETHLKPYFPDCKVCLIGSSISGFGLKGCDVDLTLKNCSSTFVPMKGKPAVIPTVEEIDDGRTSISQLRELSPKLQLRFIRRVLRKIAEEKSLLFKEPMFVVAGRCPILQFQYGPNDLVCDLSLGNSSAVLTTKLLKLCGNLDDRIVPIVKIISYWVKRARLVGSIDRFKSYAFVLMVFHFLQKVEPPILPPLEEILEKSSFLKDPDALWNYDLSDDIAKFKPSKNSESVDELLRKFFFFYFYFDFSKIICPFSGKVFEKSLISIEDEEPASTSSSTSEPSTISIRDPLQLNHNVAKSTSFRLCAQYMRDLYSMCRLYQTEGVWHPHPENNWGLAAMLNQNFAKQRHEEGPISISLPVPTTSTGDSPSHLQAVSDSVLKVLSYCLLFDCRVMDNKLDDAVSVNTSNELKLKKSFSNDVLAMREAIFKDNRLRHKFRNSFLMVHCISADTWQRRHHTEFLSSLNGCDILEKEHATSLSILESNHPKTTNPPFEFIWECFQLGDDEKRNILILLTPLESSHFPPKLSVFLKYYIPKIVKELIK